MSAQINTTIDKVNLVKWSVITVSFVVALLLNYHFAHISLAIRMIGWIVIFSVLLGLVAWTTQGQKAVAFLGDARMELRKVTWPTTQETVQTTGIVVAMVVAFGLLMWGFDTLLMFIIGLLTGQRG
jgi:preprotein translocase subunit SecE